VTASSRRFGSASQADWGAPIYSARLAAVAGNSSATSVTVPTSTSFRQWIPEVSSSTNTNSPPSAGNATANTGGYRTLTSQSLSGTSATGQLVYNNANWSVRIRYSRSGGSNATAAVTAIIYRMNSSGTFVEEIGRVTSSSLTFTTTTQTATLTFNPGSKTVNHGDVLQIDLFLNITGQSNAAILRLHQETDTSLAFSFLPPDFTFVHSSAPAALSAESNLTATGQNTVLASAALSAESGLTASGQNTVLASSTLTSETSLATATLVSTTGASALSAESSLTASGATVISGTAALSADGTLSAVGSTSVAGTAALSSESTLISSGSVTVLSQATLSGETTLVSSGMATVLSSATLSADSTVQAVTQNEVLSSAVLSSTSGLSGASTVNTFGVFAASGDGALEASGEVQGNTSALLTGQSSLAVAGLVRTFAVSALSADSSLTSVGQNTVLGTTTQTAETSLAVAGMVQAFAQAILTADGSLAASGEVDAIVELGSAQLSAEGILSATATTKIGILGIVQLTTDWTLKVPTTDWSLGDVTSEPVV
jgi:hypothetical protein